MKIIMADKEAFVPNSFQTPNAYVDVFLSYLTGEEYKVLSYATRRILGFQKRQDHISLSQFTDGTKNKEGETLDEGTGLSTETVKKCLENLVKFGLMVKVAENDSKVNLGTLWALQWDASKVNRQALDERRQKMKMGYSKKMTKARSMRHTPPNGIEGGWGNGIEGTPPNGIETQKTGEIQGNTELIKGALNSFKGYFIRFLSKKEEERWQTLYEAAGQEQAERLLSWAFKKEIHLTNRGGLLDSLETAAKNWKTPQPKQQQKPAEPKVFEGIRQFLAEQELVNG